MARRARPATNIPVTAPPRKATGRTRRRLVRAAPAGGGGAGRRPTCPSPAPPGRAPVRPRCGLVRAASAVRTLARTEMFMPMKPGTAEREAAVEDAAAAGTDGQG